MNSNFSNSEKISKGCKSLIENAAMLKKNEKVLIITDRETKFIGDLIKDYCMNYTKEILHITIPCAQNHGERVPENVEKIMLNSSTIFGLTKKSMAHTKARLNASNKGAKYLSLPFYSEEVLAFESLQINFRQLIEKAENLAEIFSQGEKVKILSSNGTNLEFSIKNRTGNPAPGCCYKKGIIASPPDSETNIAIVENSTNGVLVVDGSIPIEGFGLLDSPIIIEFKDGFAISFKGDRASCLENIFNLTKNNQSRIAAEFGVGLNPKAKLIGNMLQDEGSLGTVHIGIGANSTIGGLNHVNFHLDHIIRNPSFSVDNNLIMNQGKFTIEI
jgi:leucyl aminopeptidase (aminopeptidase T)